MTKPRLLDLLLYTLALFTLLSLSAAVLVALYGFGGGYNHHDLAIMLLNLPTSILLPVAPEILLVKHSDLFNVVAIPWLLNCIFTVTIYFAVRPFAITPSRPL